MKIGLVAEWLDTSRGGAEKSTMQFIDELLVREVSLEVFTRSRVPARPGMSVHTITPSGLTRAGRTGAFMSAAAEQVGRLECDLVHALTPCHGAHIYQPRGGLIAETIVRTIASRPPGPARVLKRLDLALNTRQRMLLNRERTWLTGTERPVVIAISEYVVSQLHHHYNYPDSHIRHIFNGVNIEQADTETRARDRREVRQAYGIEEDALLILQVCHNFLLKGVRSLIEALSLSKGSSDVPIRAVVAGRGNARRWLATASRLGVGKNVRFVGPVERVAALFHAADVLVNPTYYDPCSRVVLEGLSYGLPVISTRYDGASAAIEEGVTGFVLDSPEDFHQLAHHLQIIADAETRKRFSAAAERCGQDLTMGRHAEAVRQLYQSLMP